MKRLILFLIRRRLHVNIYEEFRFSNQKSPYDFYFIDHAGIWKYDRSSRRITKSHVSLNWILDDRCKIVKNVKGEFIV